LMTVTALFATSGATNAGLYPAAGLCEEMAAKRQFPPALGRRVGDKVPTGILITAAAAIILAVGFDLSSIASIGSAIALCVFTLITGAHLRVKDETGARTAILVLGVLSTMTVLVTFTFTTLVDEPATAVTLAVILLLCIIIDFAWKRTRNSRTPVSAMP
jgi:L-asparagine transporter-like permease